MHGHFVERIYYLMYQPGPCAETCAPRSRIPAVRAVRPLVCTAVERHAPQQLMHQHLGSASIPGAEAHLAHLASVQHQERLSRPGGLQGSLPSQATTLFWAPATGQPELQPHLTICAVPVSAALLLRSHYTPHCQHLQASPPIAGCARCRIRHPLLRLERGQACSTET